MNPFAKKAAVAAAPSESEVKNAVHAAVAENHAVDSLVDGVPLVDTMDLHDADGVIDDRIKLSKLIDDDFPFDESQLDAIDGISTEQYACLTGAAGTGKTTTTKAIVDRIVRGGELRAVDMESYWSKGQAPDADDDYESDKKWVPSIAMGAFTGRATQMIKKNFPRDWHGNIMTIHRMLGFVPEFYDDWDDEQGGYRKKMRFVPTYDADFKMPWDVYIIDEAGMLGLDLWLQFIAAVKDGARIIMIGDINQLPPVHGKSIFGYAMCSWPAWELTHVHRQQGKDNPIVDNAWRIIHGQMPQSGGRFQMIELKGDAQMSSRMVRAMMPKMQERGVYDPIRDTIITPINGEEGSRGFALGQLPLNREFALIFNPQSTNQRYIIDAGRERKQFAVGDKVMATKNDWETGITNGMTGVIVDIFDNAEYAGDRRLFGEVAAVNAYLSENPDADGEHVEFSLEDLHESFEAMDKGMEKGKEKKERGPASHIVTVRFGEGDHAFEIPFASLSEVASLMTAYVVTCHKMQGGESPTVVVICHDAHRAMLYREWLYTAVTRASGMCILLYSQTALKAALNKQKMPGKTLKEKVLAFNAAQNITIDGIDMSRDVQLPYSDSTRNKILDRNEVAVVTPAHLTTDAERKGGLMSLIKKQQTQVATPIEAKPEAVKPRVTERVVVVERIVTIREKAPAQPEVKDGGELQRHMDEQPKQFSESAKRKFALEQMIGERLALPAPTQSALVSQWGAYHTQQNIHDTLVVSHFLLAAPAPVVEKPKNPFAAKFNITTKGA